MLESDKEMYKDHLIQTQDGKTMLRCYDVYTADNECPDCMHCEHCCDAQEICDKCGPEYWWNNYIRVEQTDISYERLQEIQKIIDRVRGEK